MLYGPVGSASAATGVGSWAKIDELNWVNGKWANEIMSADSMKYSFRLPANLASGEYLVCAQRRDCCMYSTDVNKQLRSEMLALHGSMTLAGAQVRYSK